MRLIGTGACVACVVILGCGGAAQGGAPRAHTAVELPPITLCRTTEAELRAALGAPLRDGVLHDARVMSWVIGHGPEGIVRFVAVLLDARGVVVDRMWNLPAEIPWVPTDQCTRPAPP